MIKTRFTASALVLLLILGFSGCAKTGGGTKPLPPGALNAFDSISYDTLMTYKGVIDGFKTSNPIPSSIKAPLNAAIVSYNIANAAWQTYHAAGGGDQAPVTTALTDLNQKVAALQATAPTQGGTK